jgi:uncharacterized protein YndB with AHSA1/START domain
MMIGGLIRLGTLGAAAVVGVDRLLAARRGDEPPEPISTFVVIDAPIERVWAELVDIEGQPRWMHDMKDVRILSDGPIGVGTRAEADIRVLGIPITDPITITAFEPPHRFAIRHEGTFTGEGVIELEPGADGSSTILTWDETLIPPVLPELGAVVERALLGPIFQADLHRLRELIEAGTGGPAAGTGGPAVGTGGTAAGTGSPAAGSYPTFGPRHADELASEAMEAEGGPPTPEEAAEAGLQAPGA